MAACQYIIKEKDTSTVLHNQGHTPLECVRSPKAKKAFEKFSQVSIEKKKKLDENSWASRAPAKPVWLTNVDVSSLMVRQGIIKTEDELSSLAWARV